MSRPLFARGARGQIIEEMQAALGLSGSQLDGRYGKATAGAVLAFQQTKQIAATGEVDSDTWDVLMHAPIPDIRLRTLQLTSAFEGHGFTLAQGNFDGAGITWGIIGFTLIGGELGRIIKQIDRDRPGMVRDAFGENTGQLFHVLDSSPSGQISFANSISLGMNKAMLAEPWLSDFREFGKKPEVQALQLAIADEDYFQPGLVTARTFNLKTELGIALSFDIHVQNGGISSAAAQQIRSTMANHPSDREEDWRVTIANAVADNAKNVNARKDVRDRKLAIATGVGPVHGEQFVLRNWALAELPFDGM